MKILIKFTSLVILSASLLNAQKWIKTSAPTNIQYKEIRTYGNIIYAFGKSPADTTPQTLVSSFDGGQTWKVGSIPFFYTVYLVATSSGLVAGNIGYTNPTSNYTDDGGITWKKVSGTENGYFFPSGLLADGKLLFADQLYKSLSVSPNIFSLGTTTSTNVTPDFRFFAVNPSGRVIFGHDGNFGYDLAYTDDNGLTLKNISLKNLIGTSSIAPMVTYAGNNTFYTAGVNTNVLKSTDNGNTWTVCSPITSGGSIVNIKANASGRLMVSKTGNIFVTSADGGQTFTPVNNGLPANGNGSLGVTSDGKFWLAYIDGEVGATTGGIYVWNENLSTSANSVKTMIISPNPAKDFTYINNLPEDSDIRITDATGKLIYSEIATGGNARINTSRFTQGVYFIQIHNKGKTSSQKLIINK